MLWCLFLHCCRVAGAFPELGIKRCCFLESCAESPARVALLDLKGIHCRTMHANAI